MENKYDAEIAKLPNAINWVSVDFDGVVAEQIWPTPGIGEVIEYNRPKIEKIRELGRQIIIHTARPWGDYKELETWLKENEIPFDGIVLGKLQAHRYVDDKAINSENRVWL